MLTNLLATVLVTVTTNTWSQPKTLGDTVFFNDLVYRSPLNRISEPATPHGITLVTTEVRERRVLKFDFEGYREIELSNKVLWQTNYVKDLK